MTLQSSPHALVVPCAGQGHVNGAFLLAQSLSSLGFSVSIAIFSTSYSDLERNHRLPALVNPSIRIHVVPDDFEPDQPHDNIFAFTAAMRQGLEDLVQSLDCQDPVTCLISDTLFPKVQDVADKFGVPRIDYWTSNALSCLMVTNAERLYSKGYLPAKGSSTRWKSEESQMIDCIPGLPPFPVDFYPKRIRYAESSAPLVQFVLSIGDYVKRAERVLIHTVQELENTALAAFENVGIPVYPIGPLFQFSPSQYAGAREEECLKWLDTQANNSVIYVAFGSNAPLSPEDITELALGLEASEQAFLWVIRADARADRVLSDLLPEGFLERTKERGKVVEWAPQVEVLEHAAVGGFLTHCGWNSTMESIWEGVAMLGCPMGAEQNANAHYIAREWKNGIELERTEDGGLDRRGVEEGVRGLMNEEGYEAKRRAKRLQDAARKACAEGGQSRGNLQKFYEDMCRRVSS